ncbi:hypothetical protein [Kurthia huakuii]|uniref:hypothetical protein n=1 Tax=Kurthia huakuii TaxID=1421019 RepID=UPI0004B9290F|nr:hypothetical protein [Kurthia huakuii]MBM7700639.1 hypothetical protein [Kurthia huakuii]
MKQFLLTAPLYFMTGIGFYHALFGSNKLFGIIILIVGLAGIALDIISRRAKKAS